jgi:peptidoglycan/LPS O-acetylase OafA/YrhL
MIRETKADLASGAAIILLALGATAARQFNYIDSDLVTRIVLCAIGLQLAWYGNRMPKVYVPEELARKVTRVGGWSLALSGLVYAGLWVFAPFDVALWVGCGAVVAGIIVTIAYGRSLRSKVRPT